MKNIILLITDTFRFDNLYNRAKRPIHTPHLDRFADEKAVEMLNFWTGSFPTIPHRTDVITGRLGFPRYPWQALQLSGKNALPLILAEQGYATQLICDCPHLFNAGFQHTFLAAYQTRGQEGDLPLLHLNDPIRTVLPDDKTRPTPSFRGANLANKHRWTNRYYTREDETFNYRTASTAVRWLEENSNGNPFFLWTDFFDPHEPWDPPEYLVKKYQIGYDGTPIIHPNYGPASDYSPEELTNMWAHYAAEAEMVDRALGRILQKIDDLDLWKDSVVVVTSDHGFSIGERNRAGKSNINVKDLRRWPIYPEVSHVPFLIASEGLTGGTKKYTLAQPHDIMPTVAELAGAKLNAPEKIEGRSFADVLTGKTDTHRISAITSDFNKKEKLWPRAVTPWLTDGEWGYAPVGPETNGELYNIKEDPFAETDLAGDHPEKVEEMREMFRALLAEYEGTEGLADFWLNQK